MTVIHASETPTKTPAEEILESMRILEGQLRLTHAAVANLGEVVLAQAKLLKAQGEKLRNLEVAMITVASQAAHASRKSSSGGR